MDIQEYIKYKEQENKIHTYKLKLVDQVTPIEDGESPQVILTISGPELYHPFENGLKIFRTSNLIHNEQSISLNDLNSFGEEENVKGWADLKHGQEIPADEFIYYSPAVATPEQLKGFPTTFLIVGTLDLFVYEDLAFVEQLKLAGVQVDSFVEPGVPHSYNVILNDSPQTIRFKDLRDKACKQMFK